jgi:hypothetical protein
MPKPHFTTAPPLIQARIAAALRSTTITGVGGRYVTTSPALGQLQAMETAYQAGYDWPPEDVLAPATAQLSAFEAAGNVAEVARFRRENTIELQHEQRCQLRAEGMRAWAAAPGEQELAAERIAARRSAETAGQLERRMRELLAVDEQKRIEHARKRAEKEMTP